MYSTEQNLSKKERHELRRAEKLATRASGDKKAKTTRIALWSFIVIFVAGTIAGMAMLASKNNTTAQFLGGTVKAADDTDWIKGAPLKDTKVTLIEYSDFQCPACGAYYPIVKQLGQEFKNLSIIYRNFPLAQHANARPAAQAAEAAGQQGKFWEMHDLLFSNQNTWSGSDTAEKIFTAYAQSLGLDMKKYNTDFNSSETKTKIEADYQSGASEIDGTPTFFLNDKKIQNPQSYEDFRSIIQQAGGTI